MAEAPEIPHAPGCFGAALTYDRDAAECRSCMFGVQCAPRSYERLAGLRQRLGKKPPKPFQPHPVAPPQPEMDIAAVPQETRAQVISVQRKGLVVSKMLRSGKNPFAHRKNDALEVTCRMLLRRPTARIGLTPNMLATAIKRELNWTSEKAVAQASEATQTLKVLNAVDEIDGRLRVKGR